MKSGRRGGAARSASAGIAFLIKAAGHERSRDPDQRDRRARPVRQDRHRAGDGVPRPASRRTTRCPTFAPPPSKRCSRWSRARRSRRSITCRRTSRTSRRASCRVRALASTTDEIDVDEMMFALQDGRAHVKINAARALGVKGDKAARAANAMGLLPARQRAARSAARPRRRSASSARARSRRRRISSARSAMPTSEVAELRPRRSPALGERARDALVRGLETGSEARRPAGRRADRQAAARDRDCSTEAFKSPAVNVQVNAALGLGMLGSDQVGARARGAPRRAHRRRRTHARGGAPRARHDRAARAPTGPKAVTIEGFEDRFLARRGSREGEGRDSSGRRRGSHRVPAGRPRRRPRERRDRARRARRPRLPARRARSACGCATTRRASGSRRRRRSTSSATRRWSRPRTISSVRCGDADEKVAEACAARAPRAQGQDDRRARARPRDRRADATAAGSRADQRVRRTRPRSCARRSRARRSTSRSTPRSALGMLGSERVGKGRKALEGARTGGWERTREAVRKALEMLDGPRRAGPARPSRSTASRPACSSADAFTDPAKLRARRSRRVPAGWPRRRPRELGDRARRARRRGRAARRCAARRAAARRRHARCGSRRRGASTSSATTRCKRDRAITSSVRCAATPTSRKAVQPVLARAQGAGADRAAQGARDRRRDPCAPDPRADQRAARCAARSCATRSRARRRTSRSTRRSASACSARSAQAAAGQEEARGRPHRRVRAHPRGGVQGARDAQVVSERGRALHRDPCRSIPSGPGARSRLRAVPPPSRTSAAHGFS